MLPWITYQYIEKQPTDIRITTISAALSGPLRSNGNASATGKKMPLSTQSLSSSMLTTGKLVGIEQSIIALTQEITKKDIHNAYLRSLLGVGIASTTSLTTDIKSNILSINPSINTKQLNQYTFQIIRKFPTIAIIKISRDYLQYLAVVGLKQPLGQIIDNHVNEDKIKPPLKIVLNSLIAIASAPPAALFSLLSNKIYISLEKNAGQSFDNYFLINQIKNLGKTQLIGMASARFIYAVSTNTFIEIFSTCSNYFKR